MVVAGRGKARLRLKRVTGVTRRVLLLTAVKRSRSWFKFARGRTIAKGFRGKS